TPTPRPPSLTSQRPNPSPPWESSNGRELFFARFQTLLSQFIADFYGNPEHWTVRGSQRCES
ncbi:MAG: hypothetical protein VX438_11235, partial [Planctomycetota bacterium]|nr:hypothetical protein [Planctomycetota bacterium]